MRIAFLSLYSGHIDRGVETWTRDIASRLIELGHNITVFQGEEEKTESKYKVEPIRTSVNWNLRKGESKLKQTLTLPYWSFLVFWFTFRSILTLVKLKPEIVFPSNGWMQTFLIVLAGKLFGWKTVVVAHAGIGAPDKMNLLMRAHLYIFPSQRALKWAEKLFYSKGLRMINIPHGIDLNKFKPGVSSVKLGLKKPVVLCVSSLDPYKRVNLAVEAVSKMNASLLVVGGDWENSAVDSLALELLGEDRYVRTRVSPEEISDYYKLADVFTLPSDVNEAFGIVYLEAMASGLPVVATNDLTRQYVVGDAGILVDPTDIESYSKALTKAANTDWKDKPRKQAEKFSWDKIAVRYEEELRKLLKA